MAKTPVRFFSNVQISRAFDENLDWRLRHFLV